MEGVSLVALGAIFLLIAILGGDFKIFGAEVASQVSNKWLRLVSFFLGSLFVVSAIYPDLLQARIDIFSSSNSQDPNEEILANSNFDISYRGLNVNQTQVDSIRLLLEEQGYGIGTMKLLPDRTNWLAKEPTILYYDDGNLQEVQELKFLLENLLGKSFLIQMGAGHGITNKRREIIIHDM